MLSALVALSVASLHVKGGSTCPLARSVQVELEFLREATPPQPGWVELHALDEKTVYVVLISEEGLSLAAKKLNEGSCAEHAEEAARIIDRWEREPVASPYTVNEYERDLAGAPQIDEEVLQEGEVGRGGRMFAGLVGAAVGALPPLLLAYATGPGFRSFATVLFEVAFGPPVMAALALGAHRIAGGRTNYGWAILGAITSTAAAIFITGLPSNFQGDWMSPRDPGKLVVAGLVLTGLEVAMLELGDARERATVQVAATPLPGGGSVSLAGRF